MKHPLLLGHRGARASRHIPENTMASFELCLQHGCDGFEFDVRRSVDGEAAICHDAVRGGLEIESSSAQELRLPTLLEVLQTLGGRAFLDIELKVAGLERETVALLRRHAPQKGHVVSSFLPDVLTGIRELDNSIRLGFLCDKSDELHRWRELPVAWAIPHFKLANRELIEQVHAAGTKIMVWTVNDAGAIRQLTEWGVQPVLPFAVRGCAPAQQRRGQAAMKPFHLALGLRMLVAAEAQAHILIH
jgi:glycerophosphoryl diester phosphodiesterase